MESFQKTVTLPDDVRETLGRLVVNRRGEDPQSYMVTEAVVGHVSPDQRYRLDPDCLVPVERSDELDTLPIEPEVPPHL
jgi:hypothetical protein